MSVENRVDTEKRGKMLAGLVLAILAYHKETSVSLKLVTQELMANEVSFDADELADAISYLLNANHVQVNDGALTINSRVRAVVLTRIEQNLALRRNTMQRLD